MTELSEFDKLMEDKLNDFKCDVKEGTISGYVEGEETYINLMNELSALGYSYSTKASEYYKPDENIWFSKNSGKNHRSPSVDAFGSPFSLIKTTYLDCTLGSRYYRKSKENIYEIDHPNQKRRRMLNGARPTKKLDCPAWMTIKSIKVYPDFISEKLSWRTKKKMTLELKNTLKSSPPPRSFLRYYFKATTGQSHSHSTDCMQINQEIHPDLAKEIQRIVQDGTTSVQEVKMLLEQYVDRLFADDSKPKPARINKAFYPTDKVIYAHIYSAKKSQVAQAVSSLAVQNYEYIIIDGEVAEIPQVIEVAELCTTDGVQTVPATGEVIEISQMNEQVQNVSSPGEVTEMSQVDEELSNVTESCNSVLESLGKVQQNVRDKAKRIMDLSYFCNDVEALSSIHLALTEHCTQMESKVGQSVSYFHLNKN